MRTVVLDASVILKWILLDNEELVDEARSLHDQILGRRIRAIVPESVLIEVANVMFWKKGFKKTDIEQLVSHLKSGIMVIVPYSSFEISELVDTMKQHGLSIYDAYYVLLAKKNECKVVTLDKMILKIDDLAISLLDFS